eukprot:1761971-Rhodomonas_salina.2
MTLRVRVTACTAHSTVIPGPRLRLLSRIFLAPSPPHTLPTLAPRAFFSRPARSPACFHPGQPFSVVARLLFGLRGSKRGRHVIVQ